MRTFPSPVSIDSSTKLEATWSVGEKVEGFEPFHPERMASRILGMGDVVSLVEKAAEAVDLDEAKRLEEKMRKGQFTLEDFLEQLRAMKKLGRSKQPRGKRAGWQTLFSPNRRYRLGPENCVSPYRDHRRQRIRVVDQWETRWDRRQL